MTWLRAGAAFLLTAHAIGMVEFAYVGSLSAAGAIAALVAVVLGLSGEGPASEPPLRDRAATYRVGSLWSLYSLYLMSAFLMASSGDRSLAAVLIGILVLVQLVFLAWPTIGPRAVPLLVNALALCALAAVGGGYLALLSVAGYAPLAAALIVFDHHHLRRAAPRAALAPAAGHAGLAALVVWPWLPFLPLARPPGGDGRVAAPALSLADLKDGTLELFFWGGLGVAAIFLARWLLKRLRGESEPVEPEEEEPTAEAGVPQVLSPGLPALDLDLSGARGRIIRTFEAFLNSAGKLGFERRPNWTAAEFARRLPLPASRLARLFGRARYSAEDLSDRDAEAAAADANSVLERLK